MSISVREGVKPAQQSIWCLRRQFAFSQACIELSLLLLTLYDLLGSYLALACDKGLLDRYVDREETCFGGSRFVDSPEACDCFHSGNS